MRMGLGLYANCGGYGCGHAVKLDLAPLIARYGADYPVRQPYGFMSRMRCTRCGHLGATPTLVPDGYDITKQQRGYIRLGGAEP